MQYKAEFPSANFTWVDVTDPSREELMALAETYRLHPSSVNDCLDPEHLPKYEKIGDIHFLIVRSFDKGCSNEGDEMEELTRKISIFFTDRFLLSVHRSDQPFLQNMRERWTSHHPHPMPPTGAYGNGLNESPLPFLLYDLLMGTYQSYEKPLDSALSDLEHLEMSVFGAHGSQPFQIESGYYLKRRASVFKRIIRLTADQLPKINSALSSVPTKYQDLKEEADSLLFYTDELLENVNTLLNLHISLSSQKVNEASHRTGEVVRVLTIFSVFLLPLNLITGIYGMNFEHIPELKWVWGYPMALGMMVLVVTGIYLWFRRQGWMRSIRGRRRD